MTEITQQPRSNPVGIISLVVGAFALLLAGVARAIAPIAPWLLISSGMSPYSADAVVSGPPAVLGVIAVVLGIIGLKLVGRSRWAATAGITLGVALIILGIFGVVGTQIVVAMTL